METIWTETPCCMNGWGNPVSKKARQLNQDIAQTPLETDSNVFNDKFRTLFRHGVSVGGYMRESKGTSEAGHRAPNG